MPDSFSPGYVLDPLLNIVAVAQLLIFHILVCLFVLVSHFILFVEFQLFAFVCLEVMMFIFTLFV